MTVMKMMVMTALKLTLCSSFRAPFSEAHPTVHPPILSPPPPPPLSLSLTVTHRHRQTETHTQHTHNTHTARTHAARTHTHWGFPSLCFITQTPSQVLQVNIKNKSSSDCTASCRETLSPPAPVCLSKAVSWREHVAVMRSHGSVWHVHALLAALSGFVFVSPTDHHAKPSWGRPRAHLAADWLDSDPWSTPPLVIGRRVCRT